jgi:hypothetical protein
MSNIPQIGNAITTSSITSTSIQTIDNNSENGKDFKTLFNNLKESTKFKWGNLTMAVQVTLEAACDNLRDMISDLLEKFLSNNSDVEDYDVEDSDVEDSDVEYSYTLDR